MTATTVWPLPVVTCHASAASISASKSTRLPGVVQSPEFLEARIIRDVET